MADTAGTQFYHGHLSTEFGEGVMGGFLVKKTVEKTYDAQNNLMVMGREYYTLLQVFVQLLPVTNFFKGHWSHRHGGRIASRIRSIRQIFQTIERTLGS